MRFWLVDPWDALPGEIGFERGWQVAQALARNGHEVLWWQSNFAHAEKKFRALRFERRGLAPKITVVLLPVWSYRRNLSVVRLLSIAAYVWSFARLSAAEPKPDGVLVCGPIFFLEPVLLRLKRNHRIPIIFEFRDLWPEAIISAASGPSRWMRRAFFSGAHWMRRRLFRACDGIIGLNRTYLQIALKEAGPEHHCLTGVAYPSPEYATPMDSNVGRWEKLPGEIWAISSGTLGESHDQRTLIAVVGLLRKQCPHLRFLVTGAGPYAADLQAIIRAQGLTNIEYLGALPTNEFRVLLARCDIGLALYRQFSPVVFPTKIIDYLLAGLAVVTSAKSEVAALLEKTGAGLTVPAENPCETAAALAALAGSTERLAATREASCRLAREFSPEKQIAVIVGMLEQVGLNRRVTSKTA